MEVHRMRESHHRAAGVLSRLFPEKSIIIRSDSRFHCLRLSCRGQIALAAAGMLVGAWALVATGLLALETFENNLSRQEVAAAAAQYDARFAALTAERDAAAAALAEAQSRAADTLAAASAALSAERDAAQAEAQAQARRAATLEAQAQAIEAERADLADTLHRVAAALNATVLARDDAEATAEQVVDALGALEADVSQQRDRQAQLLAEVEKAATLSIAPLETMLKSAGVNVETVLEQLRRESGGETGGAGGPFIPAGPDDADETGTEARASAVIEDLQTVRLLRAAAVRMPFGAPVANPRYTSRFGLRADPLNRKRARHEGLDMAGPRGTAVRSPAMGEVIFAGVQRGYGKVVKIRHDFGFETVYAHLNRIRVRVGQRVARGARVGDLGSTGRSTGPHLHYEVRVHGKPVNPMKFIEVARNVL